MYKQTVMRCCKNKRVPAFRRTRSNYIFVGRAFFLHFPSRLHCTLHYRYVQQYHRTRSFFAQRTHHRLVCYHHPVAAAVPRTTTPSTTARSTRSTRSTGTLCKRRRHHRRHGSLHTTPTPCRFWVTWWACPTWRRQASRVRNESGRAVYICEGIEATCTCLWSLCGCTPRSARQFRA